MTIKVKLDGRDYEFGSEAHVTKLEEVQNNLRLDAKAAVEKLQLETKRADKAEGERDAARDVLTQFRTDAADAEAKNKEDEAASSEFTKERKRHRRKMERIALRFFGDDSQADDQNGGANNSATANPNAVGADQDADDKNAPGAKNGAPKQMKRDFPPGAKAPPFRKEDGGTGKGGPPAAMKDQENTDALEMRIDSMSDREVMLFCLGRHNEHFDGRGKSDDYLAARFDSMVETLQVERGITGVVNAARRGVQNLDAGDDDDVVTKARAKRDAEASTAWMKKTVA